MSFIDMVLIFIGISWFYFYHFRRLREHMSITGVVLYSTLKITVVFFIPFVVLLFSLNVLGLKPSNAWLAVALSFFIIFWVITIYEDMKIGVIKEIIDKAKGD